jgi:hypothetical protein
MKYSLRSLFLFVTLVAVVLGGRIEYLRRWAVFHEEKAESEKLKDIVIGWEDHQYAAYQYRMAMWRPWTTVKERNRETPNSVIEMYDRDAEFQKWRERQMDPSALSNSSAPDPVPPKD